MLAYVFWHWRQPTISASSYEADLIQFHRTLEANKPEGFQRSIVFLFEGAPFLATDQPVYEEWYLLDNSAAMDRINYEAVNGPCEEPHNRVARNAAGGTGGLYRLRAGSVRHDSGKYAIWFSKPAGVSYSEFDSRMQPVVTENDAALWSRTMTLGPTSEFCLHSHLKLNLPSEFNALTLPFQNIWLGQSEK
jgi:hypothetical protein